MAETKIVKFYAAVRNVLNLTSRHQTMTNWQRMKHSRKIMQEGMRRHKVVSTSQKNIFKSAVMHNIFLTGQTKKSIYREHYSLNYFSQII
jgi:HD superfamily phosphohydrolase YqeK